MNRPITIALIAGGVFLGLGLHPLKIAAEEAAATTIEATAKLYYTLVSEYEKLDKEISDRDVKAMWDKSFKPPVLATGIVRDRLDKPVPNAKVIIAKEASVEEVLGEANADATGRFSIKLKTDAYRGLTVTVTAKGFDRWAVGGMYGGLADYPVRLDRSIDDAWFAAVRTEPDRAQRVGMLLDLVGVRQMGSPELPQIYPRLGALREDLLVVAQSPAFTAKDRHDESPAKRARQLLTFWYDPADEQLIRKWVAETPQGLRLEDKSAATIEAVCSAYADAHFGNKKERTFNHFSEPVYGPDKDHALIEFTVRYASWGYSEYLMLVRQKDQWGLKLVVDHSNFHIKREP